MNVHRRVKCLLIYQWKWYLLARFWMHLQHNWTKDATWCSLVCTTLITSSYVIVYLNSQEGDLGGFMMRLHKKKKKMWEIYECWAEYLFLLVLAVGAMSGVRTYRLLFLGRCKLLITVWLNMHTHTETTSKQFHSWFIAVQIIKGIKACYSALAGSNWKYSSEEDQTLIVV